MGTATEGFEQYVSLIAQQLGHADRVEPFRGYCTGLMLPVQRKSVEPMAAQLAPTRVRSEHQRLHHFVADAAWPDDAVLAAVRDYVLEAVVPRAGAPEALLIDDTGFPKQGTHSVGVARQYCGQLGKQDNCQVAVSVSLANEQYSLPVALSPVPAQGVGRGSGAPRRGQGTGDGRLRHQAGAGAAIAGTTADRRRVAEGGRGRCRLRRGHGVSAEAHHPGFHLRGRDHRGGQRVARRAGPVAAQAVGRPRSQADAVAPRCRAPTAERPSAGDAIATAGVSTPSLGAKAPMQPCPRALPRCGCAARTATTCASSPTPNNGC